VRCLSFCRARPGEVASSDAATASAAVKVKFFRDETFIHFSFLFQCGARTE
jgi:hypothetical protein